MMMTASIEKNKAFSTLSIVAGGARGSIWNIVDHDTNDECLNKPFYSNRHVMVKQEKNDKKKSRA